MSTKFALAAVLPALFIALAISAPARADTACQTELNDVQAQWNKMNTMPMERSGNQGVTSAFRQATELCAQGKIAEFETHLNVVRKHLDMPEHPAPHDHQ